MLSLALALGGVGFPSLFLALRGRLIFSTLGVELTGEAIASPTITGDALGPLSVTGAARPLSTTTQGEAT